MIYAASDESAVRAAFVQQGVWCRELGSPLTGLLCELLGHKLDRSTPIGRRVLGWQGQPDGRGDGLPLRLAGGLHALIRRARLPALARLYPPHPAPDGDDLWRAVAEALGEAGDELEPWLDLPPQTNEVARAAALMAGLHVVAARTELPLALYELGASAGLNLRLDRYAYRLGQLCAGTKASPVLLAPTWEGPPLPAALVHIQGRRGVDLNPLDVTNPADRERLIAYIWADQAERLARTEAAIAIAMGYPPPIDQGDAADWTEAQLDPAPEPGVVRVLMHSIAFQYFPPATQRRITLHAARVGATATAQAPFAWLSYELQPEHGARASLRLRLWPDGTDQVLAAGSPHGTWLRWRSPAGLNEAQPSA